MSRGFTKGRGWGYAIDYAAAIAEDDRLLALYDGPIVRAMSATLTDEEHRWILDGVALDAADFVLAAPEARAALLGLTDVDVSDLAYYYLETGRETATARALAGRCTPGAYSRSKALAERLKGYAPMLEIHRKGLVRSARASRARHLRNAAKRAAP